MALTQEQQAFELLNRASRILVATRENPGVDGLSSVVALLSYLGKLGRDAEAVVPGFDPAELPAFLPTVQGIRPTVGAVRAFEISLDVKDKPLADLRYGVEDGKLTVTVVPEHGEWSPRDVGFRHGSDRYGLVIALGSPDMQSLGALFKDHADFLYRVPIVNIDRDPGNEHWGQLNLVDLSAVSTTEILFRLFEGWNRNLIDENIATALLAGMVARTHSFKTGDVTPQTLQTASQLMAMGARREDIVTGLWRTKTVPTLKLWGRALSRLEQDREFGLIWTVLSRQDFIEAGTGEGALDGVVRELVAYAPEARIVVLVHESSAGAEASIHALPPYSAHELGRVFGASGTRELVRFKLDSSGDFTDAARGLIDRLREHLRALKR